MTTAYEQFINLQKKLKEVSDLAGFSESFYNIIREPERIIEVNLRAWCVTMSPYPTTKAHFNDPS